MNTPLITPLQHFFRTSPQPCPYVEGRVERKLITELSGRDPVGLYNELSRAGFRRSHRLAYRPACAQCAACQPVRIVVQSYRSNRSARRLAPLNRDLATDAIPPRATIEQYRLFLRYQRTRHGDSDMAAMSFAEYRAMIEETPLATQLVTLRDGEGRLMGVCLTDLLDDGCSAVYSFYEPEAARRSLGTWLVLQLVERTRQAGLPFVYLGYFIAGSAKMSYKQRFQPLEALGPDGWRPLEAEGG